MDIEDNGTQFDALSASDLRFGSAKKFLADQGLSSIGFDNSQIGESGSFNVKKTGGPGIMSMDSDNSDKIAKLSAELKLCLENKKILEGEIKVLEGIVDGLKGEIKVLEDIINDLKKAIIVLEAEVKRLNDIILILINRINCLEGIITPPTLDGVSAWYWEAVSVRPDYGPQSPYPPCTKTISSLFSVRWISGIQVEFKRFNVAPPISECAASGSIQIAIDPVLRYPPSGISPGWLWIDGYSTANTNITLNQTYHVWARGISLNENSYDEPYTLLGSFFISASGEITRTITKSITTVEGEEPPCA